jgi:hypothetical protein
MSPGVRCLYIPFGTVISNSTPVPRFARFTDGNAALMHTVRQYVMKRRMQA